ncbi:unnamed protein product, partial [marine sediment metagenome]
EWWDAQGDGSTNDSAAIQAAIDSVAGADGGTVQLMAKNYICNIEMQRYVTLRGVYAGLAVTDGADVNAGTVLTANATGAVIDTPVATTTGMRIENLQVEGLGSGTACTGIRFRAVDRSEVTNVLIYNISDEGLLDEAGNNNTYSKIYTKNCLLDRTQAAKIGAVDITCTAVQMSEVEASSYSQSSLSDGNAYLCGIVIRGNRGTFSRCSGVDSDIGIHIIGDYNRFEVCSADGNYAHGWELFDGAFGNQLTGCTASRNGAETTNTYDGFNIDAFGNLFVGCYALSTGGNKHRYGFNDYSPVQTAPTLRNIYSGCRAYNPDTAEFLGTDNAGSSFPTANTNFFEFAEDDTTPTVASGVLFRTANANNITITDFNGGTPGQRIYLLIDDDHTTIGGSPDIQGGGRLPTRSNLEDMLLSFTHVNGIW